MIRILPGSAFEHPSAGGPFVILNKLADAAQERAELAEKTDAADQTPMISCPHPPATSPAPETRP